MNSSAHRARAQRASAAVDIPRSGVSRVALIYLASSCSWRVANTSVVVVAVDLAVYCV